MTLAWNEPLCTERNGHITDYTYSLQNLESSTYVTQDKITTDNKITFTDLSPLVEYKFSVAANTKVGSGPVATITGISNCI